MGVPGWVLLRLEQGVKVPEAAPAGKLASIVHMQWTTPKCNTR